MQQKNLVVFIVLCIVILVGWSWLQNQLWPPPKKADESAAKKDERKEPVKPPLTAAHLRANLPQVAAAAVADGWGPLSPLGVAAKTGLAEAGFAATRAEIG